MTCWIIHWAFAGEQMEGQTHTRTCSLADSYTLVPSCIYLYTQYAHIQIFVDAHTPGLCTPGVLCLPFSLSPAVDTLGCFTSVPPSFTDTCIQPAHYQNRVKVTNIFYLYPCRQIWFCSITTSVFMYHSGPSQYVFVFQTQLSSRWDPYAALLFSKT